MRNKLLPFLILFLLAGSRIRAQLLTVGSGSSMTISNGTLFSVSGLSLTPSANFTISNNAISLNTTVTNSTSNTYVSRVYKFTNSAAGYSGTVRIDYQDAELNSLNESTLKVNIHNGSSWNAINSQTNNTSSNFVVSNSISSMALNELTLALSLQTLPLQWNQFTVKAAQQSALLEWSTLQEQNTLDFLIQHSADGIRWQEIGTRPASNNNTGMSQYAFVHSNPVKGLNYYRILQRDLDLRSEYSPVRMLKFNQGSPLLEVLFNPVTKGMLHLQVNHPDGALVSLYQSNGQLLLQRQLSNGYHLIPVHQYAAGVYYLQCRKESQAILLQR